MSDVELRHLATLVAVVETGSFGRAATRLGYTQSTVSQHIAGLERAVGGRLFDRPGGPRRVQLTPLGAVVGRHADQLLAATDALHGAVGRFQAGAGRLSIGTFQSVSSTVLPPLVRRLREQSPGCDVRLSEDEAETPDLSAVDLRFFDQPVADPDVEAVRLLDDPYWLVAARGRFPAGPVALADLDGAPMVAWPPDCAQPALAAALAASAVHPEIVFHAASNEAVLAMTRVGLGSAILPGLALHGAGVAADAGLSVHPLRPAIAPRTIVLLRRAHRTPSPLAARAVRLAVEIGRELQAGPTLASAHH